MILLYLAAPFFTAPGCFCLAWCLQTLHETKWRIVRKHYVTVLLGNQTTVYEVHSQLSHESTILHSLNDTSEISNDKVFACQKSF